MVALLGPAAGTALAGQAASISASEGEPFSGVVDTVSCTSAGRITNAAIDWGDKTGPSSGTVAQTGAGTCTISGSHTYGEEGSYTITVTYTSSGPDTGSATVSDTQPNASSGNALAGTNGQAVSGVVATFSDPAPEPLGSYSATIFWGDGTSSPGSIGSGFTVSGTHTYVYGGPYRVEVEIHDEGGALATPQTTASVSGCPQKAPSQPAPKYHPSGGIDQRYVEALYHDLLGRTPSSAALNNEVAALGAGETRATLVGSLVKSAEYRADLVGGLYLSLLNRPAAAQEVNFWALQLSGGTGYETIEGAILGSHEYIHLRGNDSVDGFLAALYCQALFRPLDTAARNYDETALGNFEQGVTSPAIVATNLLESGEALSPRIMAYYLRFLRRAPSPSELQYWVKMIQTVGTGDEQLIGSILTSSEYFKLFNPFAGALTRLTGPGTIRTSLSAPARVTLTILRVLHPARDAANNSATRLATRQVGVVDFGHHKKGRLVLHWNRKVGRRRLPRGNYVLLLRAFHGRKLIYVSDALPFKVH